MILLSVDCVFDLRLAQRTSHYSIFAVCLSLENLTNRFQFGRGVFAMESKTHELTLFFHLVLLTDYSDEVNGVRVVKIFSRWRLDCRVFTLVRIIEFFRWVRQAHKNTKAPQHYFFSSLIYCVAWMERVLAAHCSTEDVCGSGTNDEHQLATVHSLAVFFFFLAATAALYCRTRDGMHSSRADEQTKPIA